MAVLQPHSIADESNTLHGEEMEQENSLQSPIFRSLSDIFGDIVPRKNAGLGFDDWPELLKHADAGFEKEKALGVVISVLHYLKEKTSPTLIPVTKILADGSRYGNFFGAFPTGSENLG